MGAGVVATGVGVGGGVKAVGTSTAACSKISKPVMSGLAVTAPRITSSFPSVTVVDAV